MDMSASSKRDDTAPEMDTLADLPIDLFIKRWRQITGEPPAVLLNSRSAMIALLVESVPIAPIAVRDGSHDEADHESSGERARNSFLNGRCGPNSD